MSGNYVKYSATTLSIIFVGIVVITLIGLNYDNRKQTETEQITNIVPDKVMYENRNIKVFTYVTADWNPDKEATNIQIMNKHGTMKMKTVVVNDGECKTALFDQKTEVGTGGSVTYKASCEYTDIKKVYLESNRGHLTIDVKQKEK